VKIRVGVIAPSSAVPRVELGLAGAKLRAEGFAVKVHPQVRRRHLFFAGDDEARARALIEYAFDPEVDVIWNARGGSGAIRLLPWLEKLAPGRGRPPRKLMVAYSDATVLMEFARRHWGWSTLHGPMLGLKEFSALSEREWAPLMAWIRRDASVRAHWQGKRLRHVGGPRLASPLEAELVGGNLTVWACVLGTRFASDATGRILFFEDVGEALYRIDRVAQQIALAGDFARARAIVLGTFQGCADSAPPVLKAPPRGRVTAERLRNPKPSALKPLRPLLPAGRTIERLFGSLGECFGIPVFAGLPVGHGPEYPPLPLGARYRIEPNGRLELAEWDWTRGEGGGK
jgi:muramoyltetrapeptide carboxypeptidase